MPKSCFFIAISSTFQFFLDGPFEQSCWACCSPYRQAEDDCFADAPGFSYASCCTGGSPNSHFLGVGFHADTNPGPLEEWQPPPWNAVQQAVCFSSMAPPPRIAFLYDEAITANKEGREGDIVEVGVWSAGLSATMAWATNPQSDRHFWLFDTFEGMAVPTEEDGNLLQKYQDIKSRVSQGVEPHRIVQNEDGSVEIYASMDPRVEQNLKP